MPANLLSAIKVRNAEPQEKPYKLRDGMGLYLEVRPSGGKFWRLRYRIGAGNPDQMFSIGEYGDRADQFTLEKARDARDEARKLIKQGIHPRQQRETLKAATVAEAKNTFKAVALEWLEDSKPHWKPRYYGQVERGVTNVLFPALGASPIRSITSADVLAVIKQKRQTPQAALLLQKWVGAIFRYAIAHRLADTDPTYAIRGAIKAAPTQHHKPLALHELPAFLDALRADTGHKVTAFAVQLLMLCFVRPGELCAAEWGEIDLDGALWVIPAERMKMSDPHYIPLSSQAVAILRQLHAITGKGKYLFPHISKPSKAMERGRLNRTIDRMGYAGRFSPHGFRATASTALNEMGHRADLIEKQLAHAERNRSRASYNQAQWLNERRAMMQQWADVATGGGRPANVVPINSKAA